MDRNLNTYSQGENEVKIAHFTRKYYDITGVMHVGTNYGYEFKRYRMMGIEYFIGFEPLKSAVEEFRKEYPTLSNGKEFFFPFALSNENMKMKLNIASGDGQGSSFLIPSGGEVYVGEETSILVRFDYLVENYGLRLPLDKIDCLVIDVEGMELNVLEGMGKYLNNFKYLNIECSEDMYYVGGNIAQEIIDFLDKKGFRQDSPIEEHNDIMFIRKDL